MSLRVKLGRAGPITGVLAALAAGAAAFALCTLAYAISQPDFWAGGSVERFVRSSPTLVFMFSVVALIATVLALPFTLPALWFLALMSEGWRVRHWALYAAVGLIVGITVPASYAFVFPPGTTYSDTTGEAYRLTSLEQTLNLARLSVPACMLGAMTYWWLTGRHARTPKRSEPKSIADAGSP